MAIAPVIEPAPGLPERPARVLASGTRALARPGMAAWACGALLVVILYAAFDHGAVSLAASTRVELGVAAVALVSGSGWVWRGRLPAFPRATLAGIGLLVAFAAWNALTLLWSVAPHQTWIEFNRVTGYVVVLGLAVAVGVSYARAIELAATGFLVVAGLVAAYALGQKVLPGLHVSSVFDLNQTGPLPRLQEPLGYWNALALFVALGIPVAVAVAADAGRGRRARLAAVCGLSLMLVTIVLTYSRGGLAAVAIGLLVGALFSRQRLRWSVWLLAAAVAAVPAVVVALSWSRLTDPGVSLSSRQGAGAVLLAVIAVSMAGLVFAGRRLIASEPRLRIDPARMPGLRRLALAGCALLGLGVVLALALSSRGLTGTFTHAWHTFTTTRSTSNYDPHHLLSADSQNRWVWWKEATGAFSDRPAGGWGAGSFGVVHLLYRRDTLSVQQPHSVPLQFLSETGLVGALLALGAFVLLVRAAARGVRGVRQSRERLLAAAMLAGVLACAVHCLYDWDWDIPAVTLPALLFLGVLVGAGVRMARRRAEAGEMTFPPGSLGLRSLGLVALTLWLCAFGLSAELPALASSEASSALVQAASGSPRALAAAQASAAHAASLDPLGDAGLIAEATIALHRGRIERARGLLAQAARREPSDERVWGLLASLDALAGDRHGVSLAYRRVLALDPNGALARGILRAQLLAAPAIDSATAVPTPSGPS